MSSDLVPRVFANMVPSRTLGEADGEFGESTGLADHVDLGDLGVLDVDRQCDAEPAVGCDDEAGIAIYQCRQRLEVALAGGGQKGLDDLPAPSQVGVVNGPAAHSGACPACELPGGGR